MKIYWHARHDPCDLEDRHLHVQLPMKRICLVVADATRARIFTYERALDPDGLREEVDLVDPARHQRASELFSDDAGANHTGLHGYGLDDHRQGHLDQLDTHFAREIGSEVGRITRDRGYRDLLVVASSRMLGLLRASIEPLRRALTLQELERDYTKLTTAELRDRLAELALLPPRPRLGFANR